MNKLFTKIASLALGAAMVVGVGVAVGSINKEASPVHAATTAEVSIADYAAAHSWTGSGGGPYKSVQIYSHVTASLKTSGGNSGKYYTDWRLYQSENEIITISTDSGTLSSITYTYTNSNTGVLATVSGQSVASANRVNSGTAKSVSGTSYSLYVANTGTKTNGQVRITAISVTYTAAASTFTVTYNANGATSGTVPTDSTAYASGATVTVKGNTGNLAKTNYEFGGWNTANDGSGTTYAAGTGTFSISANTTLYAKWNTPEPSGDYAEDTITASDLTSTGSSYTPFSGVTKTSDAVYFGRTAKNGNNMQFNSGQTSSEDRGIATSTSGGYIRKVTVTYGDANSKTLTVRVSNTAFTTTNIQSGGTAVATKLSSSNTSVTITGDYTHVAVYGDSGATYPASLKFSWEEPTTYTVTFNANGHGTAPSSQTITEGGKVTQPTAPTETGYTFGGWYKEQGCTTAWNFASDTVSADTTLWAKWTINSYTITWKNYDGSTITTSSVNHGVVPTYSGSTPTKPQDDQYTYSFTGWSPTPVAATAATSYTAQYSSTLRTYSVGGGTITNGSITSTTVNYGTSATVTITPDSGYRLPGSLGTVTMGGVAYAGAQYNSSNGQVTIPSVTGTVVINAECPVDSGTEYSITTHLTGCTTNAPASMYDSDIVEITISVSAHYRLPDTVTVTGGVDVQYTKADGTIIIDGADDDVEITVTCIALVTNDISYSLTNCTGNVNNPDEVEENEMVTLEFTANEGYFLPEDISVSGLTEDFEWDESEGVLVFVGETSDIDIEIVAIKKALTSISISPTSGAHTLGTAFTKPAVTAHFNDGSSSVVTSSATFTSTGYEDGMFVSTGAQTVTLSYTFDGHTETTNYTANVSAKSLTTETVYNKITSTDFAAGDNILIVANCSTHAAPYAMGTYAGGNNVPAASVTLTEENSRITEENMGSALVYTLEDSGSTSGSDKLYYIHNGDSYLYAASSGSNQLKASSKDTAGDNGKWLISVSSGTASITAPLSSNRNVMQFNHNNGNDMFSCYASASQTSIMVFKETEITIGSASLIQLTATGPAANVKFEGDVLSASDFVATAHYDTGTTETVTPTITSGPAKLVKGENTFTLSYTEGVTKTCSVVVIASEQTAVLDGIVWSLEGVSRTIFEGSAIGSFGTLQAHYDNGSTVALDVSECTVAVYSDNAGVKTKSHDIANVSAYTWDIDDDNGKYLGVTYEGYTKYSGVINVVETINAVYGKEEQFTFTTKASGTNPIGVGDTVVFAYDVDETHMEMTSVTSGTKGVVEEFTTNPAGTYPLTVVEGNSEGSFAFKDSENNYISYTRDAGTTGNNYLYLQSTLDDKASWTIGYDGTDVTITNVHNNERSLRYNTSSNQERISAYISLSTPFPLIQVYKGETKWVPSGESIANTNAVVQKAVLEFAVHFNETMNCVQAGSTANVSGKWSTLSGDFDDALDAFSGDNLIHFKALFAGADAVDGGDTLQDMLARYEYICHKYQLDDFLADAGRPPVGKSIPVNPLSLLTNNSGTEVAIIVVTSMIGLSAVGGYFFLRKRKENI